MLPRIRALRVLLSLRPRRRFSDAAAAIYSPKVRALPFAISATDATISLGVQATVLSYGGVSDFISSLGAYLLPGAGITPFQPTRMRPLYLPVWFLDAEVTAKLWSGDEGPREGITVFQNSYVPGFSFDPLSKIPFNDDAITPSDAVPFSQALLNQHGSDITCLPYTFSPFSLPDAVRSLSYQDATLGDLRFDPTSVNTNLLAAYPVLLPIYLAQYENKTLGKPVTFALEAFTRNGRGLVHRSAFDDLPAFASMVHPNPDTELFDLYGKDSSFVRVKSLHCPLTNDAKSKLETGLEVLVRRKIRSSSLHSRVDLTDLRVREFMKSEVEPIRFWMGMGLQLAASKTLLEKFTSGRAKATGISLGASGIKNIGENEMVAALKQHTVGLEKGREGLKPEWLKQWESCSSKK